MCPQCNGFAEPVRVRTPGEYFRLLAEVREVLDQGTMRLEQASAPLDAIGPGKPWPDDVVAHTVRCAACGQGFRLVADTYHGGGSWRAID